MNYWERRDKLFKYTGGTRQFFPLAQEQLETVSRIIDTHNKDIISFLDLGCGDGFMGKFIYDMYPNSEGIFLDTSTEMIRKAQESGLKASTKFIVQDFGNDDWTSSLKSKTDFDLIISGFAIHHIGHEKKKRLYRDIYGLLKSNGIFLNLEHVSSPTETIEGMFTDLFDEAMMEYQKHIGEPKSIEQIQEIYHDPNHKKLNKLESVVKQCEWLQEIGFAEVDCYLKVFELALFGGIKNE